MAEVQLGRHLPAEDVAEIVSFLNSLTGPLPAHDAAPSRFPGQHAGE